MIDQSENLLATDEAPSEQELRHKLSNALMKFADAPEWEKGWEDGKWEIAYINSRGAREIVSSGTKKDVKFIQSNLRKYGQQCLQDGIACLMEMQNFVCSTYSTTHWSAPGSVHAALAGHILTVQQKLSNLLYHIAPLPTQKIQAHIRWMIRSDMPEVLDIENRSPEVLDIENRSFEFPWSEESFIRCLRQRNCIGMVAEYEERIVGSMIYELHKNRLHILNFAVYPDARRRGVGTAMVKKLLCKLSFQRRNRILLEIRDRNLDGQLFFRDCLGRDDRGESKGFRAVTILHEYYQNTGEDAYLMQYRYKGRETEELIAATYDDFPVAQTAIEA